MAERDEDILDYGVLEGSREKVAANRRDRRNKLLKDRGQRTPEQLSEMTGYDVESTKLMLERTQGHSPEQHGVVPGAEEPGASGVIEDQEAQVKQQAEENSQASEEAAATSDTSDDAKATDDATDENEQQQADASEDDDDQQPLSIEERLELLEQENASIRERAELQAKQMQLERDTWRDRYNREAGKRDFNRRSDRTQDDETADDFSDVLTELDDDQTEDTRESRSERKARGPKYDPHRIARAKAKAVQKFAEEFKDITVENNGETDMNPFINDFIAERAKEFRAETEDINPQSAYKQTWRLMEQARTALLLDKRNRADEELKQKRAAIRSKNRSRKLRTQVSDSSAGKPITAAQGEDPALEGLSRKDRLREQLRRQPQRRKAYN